MIEGSKISIDELKKLARENGIIGAGGAGFPMYAKLDSKADTYIVNCAECEPILKLHRQLLEQHARQILTAVDVILDAIGANSGIIAVKEHYTDAVEAVNAEIADFPRIKLKLLPSVYPAGDELLLIRYSTGRTVAPGALPITAGVIVNNVETVYNLSQALKGRAVTHKYVTIAGEVNAPVTLNVPIGTSFAELIKFAGGATIDDFAIIVGGPMMGTVGSVRDTVTKTTNALIVLPKTHPAVLSRQLKVGIMLRRAMSACCQCRTCTELCSRYIAGYPIEPHAIMRILSNGGMGDKNAILGSFYCSGCGLCEAYSCPQGLSPKLLISELKAQAKTLGITAPKGIKLGLPAKDEELRRVSSERLCSRLGISAYDVDAPLNESELSVKKVRIALNRHIGASAIVCVSEGDKVSFGSIIGKAAENALSVNVHASVSGTVTAVGNNFVEITV